ncbi:DUF397 domain-containing protein [Streptomyces sp. NPDC060031]|uniref:DUF397 domain-containing protein n=1 Tax=Streptomyces sp. NPDC060031 TaxID=3347043 RepID=UPI00368F9DE1
MGLPDSQTRAAPRGTALTASTLCVAHAVKSSYSRGAGNNCVEVAVAGAVHVRDSKQNDVSGQPWLLIPVSAWIAFIRTV